MKDILVFDEGAYDRLMQEVVAISNASFAMKGKIPEDIKHLQTRIDTATHKARRILVDEVAVEGDEEPRTHINLDADPPKTMRSRFHPADVELFYGCNHKEEKNA